MPTRRVRNFKARAQAMLAAHPWPEGVSVEIDSDRAWLTGPGSARASMLLDSYDLDSADPAKVRAEFVRRLRSTGRDQRFTDKSRADDLACADLLEA
jgi:hypothetical protein